MGHGGRYWLAIQATSQAKFPAFGKPRQSRVKFTNMWLADVRKSNLPVIKTIFRSESVEKH
jgi:hypothetical protein